MRFFSEGLKNKIKNSETEVRGKQVQVQTFIGWSHEMDSAVGDNNYWFAAVLHFSGAPPILQ
jgi:hypothetical protein